MSNNAIERMLQINTQLEKSAPSQQPMHRKAVNQEDLNRIIESYDQQVYGPIVETNNGNQQPKWSAQAEMERLKEIESKGGRSAVDLTGKNIPANILESIINNPLDLSPSISDPRMDALTEKLAQKQGGIQNAVNVMKRIDKQETEAKAKLQEQLQPKTTTCTSPIDYALLKNIVETVIDEKLGQLKESINESKTNQNGYVPSMKYLSFKDNFYFVDKDDNVYECVMKYKGKNRKR